jgi:D-glycero-alpha-D-manno-heptose 1-phosphate guanylyltransferase
VSREAIILAGGLGTRLRDVVDDRPKPMAPVRGRPFLEYILEYLSGQEVDRVILSVGYLWETIREHFGEAFMNMELVYSLEKEPLGTGGGVRLAMEKAGEERVALLNGDTFFPVCLSGMLDEHEGSDADVTLALKEMKSGDRYGTVDLDSAGWITRFREKGSFESGLINGGVYILERKAFMEGTEQMKYIKFSLESDFIERQLDTLKIRAYISDAYFIDIGVPEDFQRAGRELPGPC